MRPQHFRKLASASAEPCYLTYDTSQVKWPYNNFEQTINPLLPSAHKFARIVIISILILEEIIKKISCERRQYESVDEKRIF